MLLATSAVPEPTAPYWLALPYWLVGAILILALFAAFQVYYWVGRRLGERLYESRIGVKVGRERIAKVEQVVEKWGALAVYGCFWVPVLRHTLPWVAGALRVSYPWYVVTSALGCLTWAPMWWFGLSAVVWGWLQLAARSPVAAASVALLAIAAVAWFTVHRRRRNRTPEQQAPAQ
ncbi:PEP-CTERM protein-sorting domain-containing protein [Nonomuraea maritima]|uniref:PEP-CTERM protein-sorting domain-containing protein n=1 Tax=Nonomuraea maritima TaxID=683260 RepID=A0A1G8UWX7_9ACTN|nr:VTT domain-containing protein [Nonomuraea maritima]SDJ58229.1 PEP-CTERM protein-sorting domain-containing protein [Nonomuraea maritima]